MNYHTTYCVYRIVCSLTGKMYIGQTSNPTIREYEHFRTLIAGDHYNLYLQRAFNKYGRNAFCFEIIERNLSPLEINERERYWIAYFDSYHNGYNASLGGDLSYRGKSCVWNNIQYDSVASAAQANNISPSSLLDRLKNGYTSDADLPPLGSKLNKPCVWNSVSYISQKEAAQALGISKEAMKSRIAKGYTCDADMPQRRRCVWNGVWYKSLSACSRETGIPITTINRWVESGYTCDHDVPQQNYSIKRHSSEGE